MLRTVSERQIAQIWQVLEEQTNLKVLQLSNDETEDLVACSVQFLADLRGVSRWLEVLQERLNICLDVSLLETITMLLSFDVLVFHLVTLQAFLLPVELKIDVSCNGRNVQILISQFHNFTLDVLVLNAV